jgi:HK97 family phage major capsid protein
MDGGGAGGTGEGGGSPNGTTATEKPKVEVQADNRKDYAEIVEMCDSNGMSARAAEFIRAGLTSDQVARKILAERTTKGDPQPGSESVEEMGAGKDAKEYSYARAILCAADNKFDGIEGEVHRELEKRLPVDVKRRGGILVPLRVNKRQTRTLDSKTIGKGVEVVPDVQGELIELLRNRAYVLQMGARLLTGLTQPISFPRQTGAIAIQWMAENGGVNVTASDPALGLATLIPKTLQATTAYSRQFLNTATIDSESWIRDEFAIVHGLAIDRAAIHGLGANGEPVGIYKQTGVGTVSFGGTVANFGKLVDMQTAVASVNALAGSLGYLMSPTAAGKMKQTLVASAAGSNMVWDGPFDNGTVAGYKAFATNQVSNVMSTNEATGGTELGVVFGNWMDFIVGLFAGMEIIVDPYALKKQGVIELTSFQMCDLLIRHPESFSKSNGAT